MGGTVLIAAVKYVCVSGGEGGRERGRDGGREGCDCVGVIVWVGVGVIAWARKGVCGWYSLNCCCKVCMCVRGGGGEGGREGWREGGECVWV